MSGHNRRSHGLHDPWGPPSFRVLESEFVVLIDILVLRLSRLHFIPLSPSYQEIYNIFTYFSGPTQGMLEAVNSTLALLPPEERYLAHDAELRKIAEAGKQWKKTIGRTLDMEGGFRGSSIFWGTVC